MGIFWEGVVLNPESGLWFLVLQNFPLEGYCGRMGFKKRGEGGGVFLQPKGDGACTIEG